MDLLSIFNSDNAYSNWFQTGAVLLIGIILSQVTKLMVNRTLKKFSFSLQRRRIIVKTISLLIFIFMAVSIIAIWGIENDDLLVFISTVLTLLGVAFFAQWSILSNITSGMILFFHHPLKIGDLIDIQDKDFPISGKVTDITYFFIHIMTKDKKEYTIPNTVVLYKMIQIVHEEDQ